VTGWLDVTTLAWLLVKPLDLPAGLRIWMLLPLVLCVATVYRATRTREPARMWRSTALTFVNIIVGMTAIALAFYVAHWLARRFL
jgi:hypothetical protein